MRPLEESIKEEKSKADEMFEKLGMRRTLNNEDTEIYRFKDDYYDFSVFFDKKLERFHYSCSAFVFEDRDTWEEMNIKKQFRDDFDKHCSRYGHWGSFPEYIDMKLLRAINEKIKELGWNE